MSHSTSIKGWLELESDPGLFTLLMEDFGVQGVQVEEIYDLQKPIEGPVYGFIFLFKWIEERRARRKIIQEEESFVMDENTVNDMFFAQQVIPNSCATHALLSVLLNCENIKLGDTLTTLKSFCQHMGPEEKGLAIGNMPDLARAHNSHARPEPHQMSDKDKQAGISTTKTMEAFHFVSYVPINGRLYELDGLKPYPTDHGPWGEGDDWTEKFRQVIKSRLGLATGGEPYHDIRFSLMAVVPDRRQQLEHKLNTLKTNRQIVLEALQQMVKVTDPIPDRCKTEPIDSDSDYRTQKGGNTSGSNTPKMPLALDGHDYAKSPIANNSTDTEDNDVDYKPLHNDIDIDQIKRNKLHSVEEEAVKISIAVKDDSEGRVSIPITVATTDVTKPLTIQTKFHRSPSPSGETTDTASEVSSLLHSPNTSGCPSLHSSPDEKKSKVTINSVLAARRTVEQAAASIQENGLLTDVSEDDGKVRFSKHQGFTPKDLLSLLKNVESEIAACESKLQDEVEKRRKYKIDDCRRTHSYDKFICTFLSMLAEQGHLTGLVEQHMSIKRRAGVKMGQINKIKPNTNSRRSRPKKRR